ncbi:nitrate reductase molybdenum cofactor assembly chaperone [Virgibacillus pantothenticus]|uniref:nitrate reductase molybdenum cofactor assembly chaperone n=1 Tax=Virgibacillus pantothenticus TaxID=1473 RepID=UPI001C2375EF|nr:nitrate reductase molybdenum cofactor assembly chaperone [Virgibacillus pantothenticus]MBU8567796.1 nitrate reductase molybdenum cofactor assembly chaperone [Virgibacillus pantothenticus]MBU8601589.1 nitrate reductase molybdenum cofactor assembly chaperone [Virgibacillus pantothenticus]MBU8635818.1 nitrate reductase molybdenum cofactor assembly chaperone [Virgibacillus pantothenticus]MBU8643524.1 nitrate reductase molybdenum cofactor assembly chaperone [Virgibacillus pantothenticus]MBU86476
MNPVAMYQMIAFLLKYPNEELMKELPYLKQEIEHLNDPLIKNKLHKFIEIVSDTHLTDWVDHYIETFDFGKVTNLYVTYLKLGEHRKRGMELLQLKNFYEQAGFFVTDKELPDYLPLMLEFCAQVSMEKSNELLQLHSKSIWMIREKLSEAGSYYDLLFDALFLQMEANGLEIEPYNQEIVNAEVR